MPRSHNFDLVQSRNFTRSQNNATFSLIACHNHQIITIIKMNDPICSECNALLTQHNGIVHKIKYVCPECYNKRGNDDVSKIACEDFDEKINMIDDAFNALTQLSSSNALAHRVCIGSQSRSQSRTY